MAPKKNGYFVFIIKYKNELMATQKKFISFQELAQKLTPVWNSMSADEKNEYKILADKENSKQKQVQQPEQIMNLHNSSEDYWNQKEYLKNMFELITDSNELFNKKFILLHVNCHTHHSEQFYFPAEIAALEFNLSKGLLRTYHQIIGISNDYPRGYAGGMREYSDQFHKINCWDKYSDDYKKILLDFLNFLKGTKFSDLNDNCAMDLPFVFTIETEMGVNIMKTKNSLERLYQKVFPEHEPSKCKSIFKIGSMEQLLFEMKKKIEFHSDNQSLVSGMISHDILELDLYGFGLGCSFHEERNIAFTCSKARILQWMSNICIYTSQHTKIHLIPGKHLATQLNDGSRLIIENKGIPLAATDLKVKCSQDESDQINPVYSVLQGDSSTSSLPDHLEKDENSDEDEL